MRQPRYRRVVPTLPTLLLLLTVPGGLGVSSATAAEPDTKTQAAIDALFTEYDRWDRPGLSLAVVRDGKLFYARGYGCANLEYSIPITPATIFHVASVSKQFTCFAIVLLAEEGKLSLDDDVRKHLPELPDFGMPVTLRQLMNHTSGVRDQWELLALAGWRLDDVITRDHIMKMMRRQRELNFPPGSEHLYSNMGYTLLAEVVEKVSGTSLREFAEARIFKPLGMTHTHFHDDHEEIVPNRAYSYSKRGEGYQKRVLSYANVGATSLFTTVEDMARWLANFESPKVGTKKTIETMQGRGKLTSGETIDYALGLSHGTYRGLHVIGHGGADAGFRSQVVRFPEHGLGIVVLGNFRELDPRGQAMKVAELLLADHLEPEQKKEQPAAERIELPVEKLEQFAGKYALDNGVTAAIEVSDGRLLAKIPDTPQVELVPTAEKEFFIKELGAHVTFAEPGDDGPQALTAEVGGETIKGRRVTDAESAAPDLAPLAGRYYSPELETVYDIVVDGNALIARHQRHGDIRLTHRTGDQFGGDEWFFGRVEFDREQDKVSGFRVSGGRVRNLRFQRQ